MQASVTESDRDRSNDSAALPRVVSVEPKMAMNAFRVKQPTFSKQNLSLPHHHVYNPIALHSLSESSLYFMNFYDLFFEAVPSIASPELTTGPTIFEARNCKSQLCGLSMKTPLAVRPTKLCDTAFNTFHKKNDMYWKSWFYSATFRIFQRSMFLMT